jgi:hypothetical protein
MPEYRIFRLDDAGHPRGGFKTATHKDDPTAIIETRKTLDGHTVEIWDGLRRVATLKPNDDTPRV